MPKIYRRMILIFFELLKLFQCFTLVRCFDHNCEFNIRDKDARASQEEGNYEETQINATTGKDRTCPESSFRLSSQSF